MITHNTFIKNWPKTSSELRIFWRNWKIEIIGKANKTEKLGKLCRHSRKLAKLTEVKTAQLFGRNPCSRQDKVALRPKGHLR